MANQSKSEDVDASLTQIVQSAFKSDDINNHSSNDQKLATLIVTRLIKFGIKHIWKNIIMRKNNHK